ncbi:MAG: methyltransferase domain-containing protein [Chloroflexi bacterium]|nr:methyltransferase domain-containing protein [Chloroflexota bacterium]
MHERRAQAIDALRPYIERARGFSGWTFDDVAIRHLGPTLPWDYERIAREHALAAASVVDLGTGGGERLAGIVAGAPGRVVATEEWVVNAPVARERLAPLGVDVVRADSLRLPFAAEAFDLVLDRHEALEPAEVARVLGAGGRVVTQQCGPHDWPELSRYLPTTAFPDHYRAYQEGFRAAGLLVEDARWHEERIAFATLGDLVYILLLMPWDLPEFDPVASIEALMTLEEELGTDDGIVVTEIRYLIVARRP